MTDYKRAYHLPDGEWLFEERRGNTVLGTDQGKWELDWKIEYPNEDREVVYRLYNGWSNDGPEFTYWLDEKEFDRPDFMTDDYIRNTFEAIEDPAAVQAFVDSRVGLRSMLSETP